MRFLTRTIIVLVVFNLAMGNFALAQNAPGENVPESSAEPTARARVPVPTSSEPLSAESPETEPSSAEPSGPTSPKPTLTEPGLMDAPAAPPPPSLYPRRAKRLSHISSRKVLIIPATDVKVEELDAITQDLQIMSHIFDERFNEPRLIKGAFVDFGDFFGRDSRETEAIYIQGYGALFLMEVNFSFTPPPKEQEQEDEQTAKDVDPTWQRAKQKIFSPKGPGGGSDFVSEESYSAKKIDQLKTELIKTLKHTANIRNLKADEWVILTVIGQGRQPGEIYEDYYRSAAPRDRTSTSGRSRRSSSSSRGSYSGGSAMGGGVMMGGGGFGGVMMGGGGFGSGMMGGMEYGEMAPPSTTVLTIRAKKSDVDAFAKDELDFEQFQQMVQIFTY